MIKKIIGWTLFILSLIMWSWLFWPITPKTQTTTIKHGMIILDQSKNGPVSSLPLDSVVTLNWSPVIKLGDQSKMILNFSSKNQIGTAGLSSGSGGLFRSYNVELVTKVDLLYFIVTPSNLSGQPFEKSYQNIFTWHLTPLSAGKYNGIVWVYMQFFPVNGGEMTNKTLLAIPVEIRVISFLGLRTGVLFVLSSIFLVLGLIILIQSRKTSKSHTSHN